MRWNAKGQKNAPTSIVNDHKNTNQLFQQSTNGIKKGIIENLESS